MGDYNLAPGDAYVARDDATQEIDGECRACGEIGDVNYRGLCDACDRRYNEDNERDEPSEAWEPQYSERRAEYLERQAEINAHHYDDEG